MQLQKWESLDYYSDADPNHKSIRGNGITKFFFHVAQCNIFNLTNHVKKILIANVSLKTFYSRLGFSVIKDFATSTTFEAARRRFYYDTGKYKVDQKKNYWLTVFIHHPTTCYISSRQSN